MAPFSYISTLLAIASLPWLLQASNVRVPSTHAALLTRTDAPAVFDTAHNITYIGVTMVNASVEKFLNIPFGQDTGGLARFTSPKPAVLSAGLVYDASRQGPICPQQVGGGFAYESNVSLAEQSEDCLRLKVARPAGTREGDALPVMVYIYGGKFML
jgi:hypothetical protein